VPTLMRNFGHEIRKCSIMVVDELQLRLRVIRELGAPRGQAFG
jgi:hypothetical protein